jgi:AP-1 complex subunit sigma 1/2
MIHEYVEVLDKYFGNVCELDIIFNFHKGALLARALRRRARVCARPALTARRPRARTAAAAAYYILDELFIGGELQETNKREVMRVVVAHEALARQESDLSAGLFE